MYLFRFILLLICFVGILSANKLKIGIVPYTDTLKILQIHQPLKEYLASSLNKDIEIYTSLSYEKFFEDTHNNQFDIIITGPHFGVMHIENGFIPLARYDTTLTPVFVVLKTSKYKKISDLKNTTISLSNYLSLSSIGGIKTLVDEGLNNEVDFKLVNYKSHASAMKSVVLGESDAAITTYTPIKQLTDESITNHIRVIESDFAMPHLFTIASPNLDENIVNKVKNALFDFYKIPSGESFFANTGYKGYIEISKEDLQKLTPAIKDTKKFLGIE